MRSCPLQRLVRGALLCAAALAALPAAAGPSPAQMLERHRTLVERAAGGVYVAPAEARSKVAVQAGRRPATAPPLIDDELYGGTGIAVEHTLLDGDTTPLGAELRLGALALDGADRVRLVGSRASVPLGAGHAYASYEQRHWGPGWFGSLILDGGAPPLAAVGWRSDEAGARWQADLFAGRLGEHSVPADPWLIGMRLEWRPGRAWTVGLSRTMQWGGEGRSESAGSFFDALIGRDHSDDFGAADDEPGNQLAGGDIRYDFAFGDRKTLGAYGELIAEDFSGRVPTRRMRLFGIDASAALGALSVRAMVEVADTTAGKARGVAYRHHIYEAGYTHRGQPLGHPAGGDVRLASAGLLLERGPASAVLALHRGRAEPGAQRFVAGDALRGADLTLNYAVSDRVTVGASAHHWRAGAARERWAQLWASYSFP